MALDAEEQELFDFAVAALPKWFTSDERQREDLAGFAKLFGAARATVIYWFSQTYISQADGPVAGLPDWLNQHAIDMDTRRQAGESDDALKSRLRNVPEALVRSSILAAANAILVAEGVAGEAAMVELPRDGAYSVELDSDTSIGGEWAASSGTRMIFTPTTRFARPPYRDPSVVRSIQSFRLDISGSANPANDGQFQIIGLAANGAIVNNAGGVPGVDAGATWTVRKVDRNGFVRDAFQAAYSSRGYRSFGRRPLMVIILPFGSTEGTASSVREMLRQKKAAGVAVKIERRLSP